MDDETFEIIKAGAPDGPPEQALYRIQQTYPDGSGVRLDPRLGLHGGQYVILTCVICGREGCRRRRARRRAAGSIGGGGRRRRDETPLVHRGVPARGRRVGARDALAHDNGGGRVTDWWRKPRKWNLPLTYGPKIAGVRDGTIRQTIRVGRKFRVGDLVSFHGWSGRPYRSPWSFRTEYYPLTTARNILILSGGIVWPGAMHEEYYAWRELDCLAARDGIEPPTGEALRDVLAGMHKIPDDGIEAQVLRW